MKHTLFVIALGFVLFGTTPTFSQPYKALFDNTKNETAGNADWIIDTQQPIPSPAQSGITPSTPETYWLGAISAWGVDLVKKGFTVHTLTSTYGITYGNLSNAYDLSNYDLFIVCEPQNPFTAAEKLAIKSFVQNGGGLMMVADHNASDRDSDGWDSPEVWNALPSDTLFGIHFQSNSETNNYVTGVYTNLAAGTDSIINGSAGTVTALSYHGGTTMRLLTTLNTNTTGHIWMNGITKGTTQIVAATSRYGSGKVAAVGDSSPADDSTGQSGNTLYNGWTEAGATDNIVFLNMCLWLVSPDQASVPAQVTLTSPSNTATNQAIPVTFRWRSISGVTKYEFDLSTSSTFSSYVTLDSALTDTQKVHSSMNLNTTYYWRVRAKNAVGWGTYSATWSLTTFDVPPQVTLTSPANAATAVSIPTTFRWRTISGTTKFEFDLSTSSGFSTYVTLDSALTDTQKVMSGLDLNTAYYWRVRAKNSAGWGVYSSVWNVTTFDVPTEVMLIQPENAATAISLPTTFTWHFISGATKYEFDLSTSPGFSPYVTLDSTLTDIQKVVSDLGLNSTYYWRVRAKNSAGWGTYSLTFSFTTWDVPSAPVLDTPADGAVDLQTPIFCTWNQVQNITSYQFILARDSGCTSIVFSDSTLLDTVYSATSLLTGQYYWHVRAKNAAGWSNFSPVWKFSVLNLPATVLLQSPAHQSFQSSTTTQFTWHATTDVGVYQIQCSELSAFDSLITLDSLLSDTALTVDLLKTSTTYYWRVRAQNAIGWGEYSDVWSITISDSSMVSDTLHEGWNLISLPFAVSDPRIQLLFPSAISSAFMYQNAYIQADTLECGAGYWIKFDSAQIITLAGIADHSDTISVHAGWNLVGVYSNPVVVDSITTLPVDNRISVFFSYNFAYTPASVLSPLHGYWVKCREDGIIIFHTNE